MIKKEVVSTETLLGKFFNPKIVKEISKVVPRIEVSVDRTKIKKNNKTNKPSIMQNPLKALLNELFQPEITDKIVDFIEKDNKKP